MPKTGSGYGQTGVDTPLKLVARGNVAPTRVLITGVTGSGGSYLADWILKHHPEVELHGFSRWHSTTSSYVSPAVEMHEVDLMDMSSIIRGLNQTWPQAVFHMASHANVRASFDTPLSVLENNTRGTANLLEALRMGGAFNYHGRQTTFVMCSSSEVYGQVGPEDVPIKETCRHIPSSPYAVSKQTQDSLSHCYYLAFGIPVIRTRMFSYFNPRRKDLFATSFARQVVEIENGKREVLKHGNLDSTRTLIDIRDACAAYWAALDCVPGEAYNIGGTSTMSVGEFLETLKTYAKVPIKTEFDPKLSRPADVTLQIPDTTKFRKQTGWEPKYSFEDSVKHLMEHCRK